MCCYLSENNTPAECPIIGCFSFSYVVYIIIIQISFRTVYEFNVWLYVYYTLEELNLLSLGI